MRERRFHKGNMVKFQFGLRTVPGPIKEDRGPIGVKGRRLYLIEFPIDSIAPTLAGIELPAETSNWFAKPNPSVGECVHLCKTPADSSDLEVSVTSRLFLRLAIFSCLGSGFGVMAESGPSHSPSLTSVMALIQVFFLALGCWVVIKKQEARIEQLEQKTGEQSPTL
jgi:hypothetical protein